MPRTPKVVEDRREQILDAAMRVFAQKGFSRATNRDVAQEAGITTGLIYYYFANKEALLQAVLETYSPVKIMTQITPEMLEQPPEVLMPLLVMRVLGIAESEQFVGIIRMILPEMLHNPGAPPVAMDIFQRVLSFLGHYLHIQMAKGTVRADLNPDLVMQVLVSSLVGFVFRRQIIRDPSVLLATHAEIAQAIVEAFLQGIQPR
jgi:TetR/AcrR family transcriptional regulator, cholesterol catabolism regulator